MRRLAFAAAVCGSLFLAACSDQSQSPTEPPAAPAPEPNFGSCQAVRFPIVNVAGLIVQVFPKGTLRTQALLQAAAVALLWDTCHPVAARKVAVDFVKWIDLHAPSTAPASKVLELKLAILNGVGIPTGTPSGSPGDFGVGTFDPNNPNKTLIKTTNGTALIELEPGAFTELTTIVLSRNPDATNLTNFDGNQFPPNFDYNAINASGNHVLGTGHPAIIAFCLENSDFVTYPANRGIGHNPVAGAPNFPFEILDPVDLGEGGRSDLAAALHCGNLAPTTAVIGGFGQGLPGFANAAWRTAREYLAPVAQAVFLPEALHAATLGTLPPPIGGKAPSLTPFKVVEPATITPSAGDGQSAPAGTAVPVPPAVVVRNASTEAPVPGVSVTFAVASGGGSITGPTAVTNASGVAAVGSWTLGAAPGTNTLTATAKGLIGSPVTFTATTQPAGGGDILVINDMNMLQNDLGGVNGGRISTNFYNGVDPVDNIRFFKNVVSYSNSGPRGSQNVVLFHRGHNSQCAATECAAAQLTTLYTALSGIGFTAANVDDGSAGIGTIASNVKVIFLMTPRTNYSAAEVTTLNTFLAEGGRLFFVGENPNYYGVNVSYPTTGFDVENNLLLQLGKGLQASSTLFAACDHAPSRQTATIPAAHIASLPVTSGVSTLSIPCAAKLILSPGDILIADDIDGIPAAAFATGPSNPIVLLSAGAKTAPQSSLLRSAASRAFVQTDPDGTGLGRQASRVKP